MSGYCGGVSVHVLADRPHLCEAVGEMRWQEWGAEPGSGDLAWWVAVTKREAGRQELPVTWVAVDEQGTAAGAVGLGEFDLAERRDRSPWVLGMIVQPACRKQGVGRLLISRVEEFAAASGYSQVWVATENAAGFYQQCGWEQTERLQAAGHGRTVILTRRLPSHRSLTD